MVDLHPEYVIDGQQRRKAVMLPIDEWEQILEALEEFEDIQAYDSARSGPQDAVPFEDTIKELEAGPPA